MDTMTQEKALQAIEDFRRKNGYFPIGMVLLKTIKSKATNGYRFLEKLEKKKLITKDKNGHIIATTSFPPPHHGRPRTAKKRR